jgi:5-methylcytosine-specific restriction endonuclease McrA
VPSNPRWSRAWEKRRRIVLERDGGRCMLEYPGCEGMASHVDHVVPRKYGGTDELANLRAACRRCNLRRGDGTEPIGEPVSAW